LCVTLTKNPCHDNRSKHIDIKTSLSSWENRTWKYYNSILS
jgi:hypothetical protein